MRKIVGVGIGEQLLVIPTSQFKETVDDNGALNCARWYNKVLQHKATYEPASVPVTGY